MPKVRPIGDRVAEKQRELNNLLAIEKIRAIKEMCKGRDYGESLAEIKEYLRADILAETEYESQDTDEE